MSEDVTEEVGEKKDADSAPEDLTRPLRRWKKYWHTRKLVRVGGFDYVMDVAERARNDIMDPWTFQKAALWYASLPSIVVGFVAQAGLTVYQVTEGPSRTSPVRELALGVFGFIMAGTSVYVTALLATAVAYVMAWASLRPEDRVPTRIALARNAFLYELGSRGLRARAVSGLGVMVMLYGVAYVAVSGAFLWLAGVGLLMAVLSGGFIRHIMDYDVPEALFLLHGYRCESCGEATKGPWTTYGWVVRGAGAATAVAVMAWIWAASVMADVTGNWAVKLSEAWWH